LGLLISVCKEPEFFTERKERSETESILLHTRTKPRGDNLHLYPLFAFMNLFLTLLHDLFSPSWIFLPPT
jgi:hypothetical protein